MCEELTIMDKTSDMMLTHVYKRIIYFDPDSKDLVTKVVKVVKDEILTTNNYDTFELIVFIDSIGISCNDENIIKQIEQLIISKLPDNILVYPHYTTNLVNFEDIRKFQSQAHLPLGQCIVQSIQVNNNII